MTWIQCGVAARWMTSGVMAVLALAALPAQAQRVSLPDLQKQIAASVTCPAALPGQGRFVDNGNNTICDSATGLMWEKKQDCGGVDFGNPHCVANRYTWTRANTETGPNGSLYYDFLEQLNDLKDPIDGTRTTCFAGYCDWRIPTIGELRSILSAPYPICSSSPCIDAIFGPTQAVSYSLYWSSSPGLRGLGDAWGVYFDAGYVDMYPAYLPYYARAVRGGR